MIIILCMYKSQSSSIINMMATADDFVLPLA